jgi:hypothetical protein
LQAFEDLENDHDVVLGMIDKCADRAKQFLAEIVDEEELDEDDDELDEEEDYDSSDSESQEEAQD